MIVGLGQDIVDVPRVRRIVGEYGDRFLNKVFTPSEIAYCLSNEKRSAERFAARFAAKEAFSKAIGTGIRMGFRWREISVEKLISGKPVLVLDGSMNRRFGSYRFHLSLSHTDDQASAVVILESPNEDS